MRITSIYIADNTSAIATLATRNDIIIPVSVWRSRPDGPSVIEQILDTERESDTYIVNASVNPAQPQGKTVMGVLLSSKAIHAKVSDPFKPAEGSEVFSWLNNEGVIESSLFPGWVKLCAEMKALEPPASVMAFYQGLIEAQLSISQASGPLLSVVVDTGPEGYIPVERWGNGLIR